MGFEAFAAKRRQVRQRVLNQSAADGGVEGAGDLPIRAVAVQAELGFVLPLNPQRCDFLGIQLPKLQRPERQRVLVKRVVNLLLDREYRRTGCQLGVVFRLAFALLADQQGFWFLFLVGEGQNC